MGQSIQCKCPAVLSKRKLWLWVGVLEPLGWERMSRGGCGSLWLSVHSAHCLCLWMGFQHISPGACEWSQMTEYRDYLTVCLWGLQTKSVPARNPSVINAALGCMITHAIKHCATHTHAHTHTSDRLTSHRPFELLLGEANKQIESEAVSPSLALTCTHTCTYTSTVRIISTAKEAAEMLS